MQQLIIHQTLVMLIPLHHGQEANKSTVDLLYDLRCARTVFNLY